MSDFDAAIDIPDEGSLGAKMLNHALAEERGVATPDSEPVAPAAPAPEAPTPGATEENEDGDEDAAPDPSADPSGLGNTRNWEQLADGKVKLANGHTYENAEAALDALFHAQQHIATTRRAPAPPEPELELPDPDDDEDEEDAEPLLRPGMPLGGEPATLDELAAWAIEQPAEAAIWALGNQQRLRPQDVRELYQHWVQEDPAGAANYNIQIQQAQAKAEIEAMREELRAELSPVLEERKAQQVAYWTEQINALPLMEHYGPRIAAFAEGQGQAYIDYLSKLDPQEEYEELRDVYSRLRVDDSIAASLGDEEAQAVLQATAAAAEKPNGGRPIPTPPAGVPHTEGRGRRGPAPTPPGDPTEIMRAGIAAYTAAADPFGDVPS
jgi:hypothetical protein